MTPVSPVLADLPDLPAQSGDAPADAAAVIKSIEKDRAETEAWLKSDPTSYLATIDRKDFLSKTTLTVGRAADNDVRIDSPDVQPHHLRVTVDGDRFVRDQLTCFGTRRAKAHAIDDVVQTRFKQ